MGTDWSKWFFSTLPGGALWVCTGLLIIAGLSQFGEIYKAKWPLAVYLGALLVLVAGISNFGAKIELSIVFTGFALSCIGLFGLLWTKWDGTDMITAALLFLAIVLIFGFFSLRPQLKSIFFVPHVFVCFLSYIFIARAAFLAVRQLFNKKPAAEEAAYRLVRIGFAFLTAGIAIGSVWAACAWGDWWGWDPKETFSFAVWLVFAAFLHFRYLYKQRFLRLNSVWIICGFILIVLSFLLVNFSKIFAGLHSHSG
jgi:ABC-type transport system involved in cytochrome c biogenesis permease subunit